MIIEILSLYGLAAALLSLLSLYRAISISYILIFSISPIAVYLASRIAKKKTLTAAILFLLSAIALLFFDNNLLFKKLLPIPILLALDAHAAGKSRGSSLIRLFDISLIASILVFSYNHFYGTSDLRIAILSISNPLAILYALYLKKANLGRNARIPSLIISIALIFVIIGFMKFEATIESGASAIASFFSHIFSSIYSFFIWLFSFIPHINWSLNNDIIPNGVDTKYNQHDVFSTPLNTDILKAIALIAISTAALCILIYILKNARLKKHEKEHKSLQIKSEAPSLLRAIKRAINELKQELSTLIFMYKNISNSIGLALWLERKLRHSARAKNENESYSSFLRRLYSEYENKELLDAAEDISSILYSKEHSSALSVSNLHSIKRRTYVTMLRDLTSKLKQR